MAIVIKRAVKYGSKLRLALYGPSGSGKTFTALKVAFELASDKKVCVIDTERGSASKYADVFPDFDVIEIGSFHPNTYIEAINAVIQSGEYSALVIDSASHEWEGSRGALELAGRDFTNWATVTPLHNKFIDTMLAADIHVIATMRAKEEHVMEKEEGKKAVIRKMGMEPIQRKGMQYEFDIVCSLGMDNLLTVEKTRCSSIKDQAYRPGSEKTFTGVVQAWLNGEPAPEKQPTPLPQSDNLHTLIGRAKQRAMALGLATDKATWEALLQEATGEVIQEKDINLDRIAKINAHLARIERQRKEPVQQAG